MHHLPLARHVLRKAAGSGVRACMVEILEAKLGPSASANRRAVKTAAIKSGGVKAASTKAATSVETTAAEAAVEATEAAMTAASATTRRHNVGCKHSKCCSRQQRDRDLTEHEQPSLVQEDDAQGIWPAGSSAGRQAISAFVENLEQGRIPMEPANPSTGAPYIPHGPSQGPTVSRSPMAVYPALYALRFLPFGGPQKYQLSL